ncbi:hypothetical protein ACH5RR_002172 [Cinchona calisaya]|uniref:Uncharacterized protein n=1 Tax=Cinchona calisaya TaxID=153742 RepID=A0ABD3B656_9GENT
MESSIGGMADREWNPLSSAIYSTSIDQEADFIAQLNNCSLPNTTSNLGFSWCSHNESDANMVLFEECSMPSMYSFSQGSSYTYNSGVSPIYYNPNNSCHISANNNTVEAKNKNYFVEEEEEDFLNQDLSNVAPEDTADNLSEMNSKKRSLIPLHKNKRKVKAKKNDHEKPNYSTDINIAEGRHPVLHRQSSGSCLSEDDSNASNLKGASAAPNSNGKITALPLDTVLPELPKGVPIPPSGPSTRTSDPPPTLETLIFRKLLKGVLIPPQDLELPGPMIFPNYRKGGPITL